MPPAPSESRSVPRHFLSRYCSRKWFLIVLTVFLVVGGFWLLCQPRLATLAEQVQIGMTRDQVETIMGQPQIVEGRGHAAWWDGFVGVGVIFDANNRVSHKTETQRVSGFDYLVYRFGWR